ncbi:MAG: glucokinase [Deltaproteobacteria bacterium]|nr:glucokinase [Deltaproteobacteria bacterium]
MEHTGQDPDLVLAGDIGGTKTHMGLFSRGKGRPRLRVLATYESRKAAGLEDLVARFMAEYPSGVRVACFGIAGPVSRGRSRTTNLPWVVSESRLEGRFNLACVRLLNDLAATAWALPLLRSREQTPINRARGRKGGNLALVAPGTGLGEALVVWDGKGYLPVSSEGGHADFSPGSRDEIGLWEYLHERYGHVSMERILSGPGLLNLYSWLRDSGRFEESARVAKRIAEEDPPRVISEEGLMGRDPLCSKALEHFVSILGAEAGNLALKSLALGGVYLGGGIPPKILERLKNGPFMAAFTRKGRFANLMERIPVRVILNQRAALLGAAHYAFQCLSGPLAGKTG